MTKMRKLLVVLLAVVACLSLAVGLAACNPDESAAEKATIKLGGQTPDAAGEYSATITANDNKVYTLIVGGLTDYEFETASSDSTVATATVSQTSLTVYALKAGSAKITVSEKADKAHDLIINVAVDPAPVVAPESLTLSGLTGEGTAESPYAVSVAEGKSQSVTMAVQPNTADKTFTWTVGTLEEETFTAGEGNVNATQSGTTLTITGGQLTGETKEVYYIQGKAQTGELTVYIKVTLNEYVALTSLKITNFPKAEDPQTDGYDYVLRTARYTNWNLDEVAGRLTNGMDKSEGERPADDKISYYQTINKFTISATPYNATDKEWVATEEGDNHIFEYLPTGTWRVTGSGETIVKITNSANEASVRVKFIVEDALYTGVLKDKFDAATAATNLDWAFDDHADDTVITAKSLLAQWYFAMNKTTTAYDRDDNGQKIFWLGGAERPYGFDLETKLVTSTGATTEDTLALAWIKAAIPEGATTLQAILGNNNKDFTKYRLVLVKEDGTAFDISNGWQVQRSDGEGTTVEYAIPAQCKGATVAIVVEAGLTKAGENAELHCKGIWINTPITGINLEENTAEVSQGSTYQISYSTVPSKVIDDKVTYSVTQTADGGEGKLTIDNKGMLTVATDAPVGTYVVTVASVADASVKATLTVTVNGYVRVAGFTGTYTDKDGAHDLANANISAKAGSDAVALAFTFNPTDASVQRYTITYKDNANTEFSDNSNVITIKDGKLSFAFVGTVVVKVTPDAEEASGMAITFTVTVREGSVLNWGEANQHSNAAILGGSNPWVMTNGNATVSEGADIQGNGSYIEKKINVSDMDTLLIYIRLFNTQNGGESAVMEVSIDGTVIYPKGSSANASIPESPASETAQPFYYDLSEYTGEVTIRITNVSNYHCVIQQITIS